MFGYKERMAQVDLQMAVRAYREPLIDESLWFHRDIRDNYYYASYLWAAAVNDALPEGFDKDKSLAIAESAFLTILGLQDRDPSSDTYGHFPLQLGPEPRKAKAHVLPAELMGSLIAYFYRTFRRHMNDSLRSAFEETLKHLYHSTYYRQPLREYNHHEAKYTAAKLIFGYLNDDVDMLNDGHRCLRQTLERVENHGLIEYGGLPWFWHWVQAFCCVRELVDRPDIREDAERILDFLWKERCSFYLQGAWAGARSRSWPHDLPRDRNVAFDYVQFGDFELPDDTARTEYAGFLYYPAPEPERLKAIERSEASEVRRRIVKKGADGQEAALNSYMYITSAYAVGGMQERFEEFDNEQHRWDIALPLKADGTVNHAYFFHPGAGYAENDPRHQSRHMELMLYRNVVLAVFPIPAENSNGVIGVLPPGQWIQKGRSLFGQVGQVVFSVHMMQDFHISEERDRVVVQSDGKPNALAIEVMEAADIVKMGCSDVKQFADAGSVKTPMFTSDEGSIRIEYAAAGGDLLDLFHDGKETKAQLNGKPYDWARIGTHGSILYEN